MPANPFADLIPQDQGGGTNPFADLIPASDVGRVQTAASQFARGASQVLTDIPKTVPIAASAASAEVARLFDLIDQGEDIPEIMAPEIHRGTLRLYKNAAPEERDRLRREFSSPEVSDPRTSPLYQAGEEAQKAVESVTPVNPEYEQEFLAGQLPRGLGSTVGFLAAGVAGRGAGIPAAATAAAAGAATASAGQFSEALNKGATIEEATRAAGLSAIVGTSEAMPIATFLDRFDKATGGRVKRMLIDAAKQGGEELAQEVGQTIAENLIASKLVAYDPERGVFSGTGEAASVGFSAGALMQFVAGAIGGRRGQGRSVPITQEDIESPIPTDLIAEGKVILQDAQNGAVPAETVIGAEQDTTPEEAPSPPQVISPEPAQGEGAAVEPGRSMTPEAPAAQPTPPEETPPQQDQPGVEQTDAPQQPDVSPGEQEAATVRPATPAESQQEIKTPFEDLVPQGAVTEAQEVEAPTQTTPAPPVGDTDTSDWIKERDERIKRSKAAGNKHLDQVEPYVETMRGLSFYNVHDPKERGTIRTVATTGDVVVHWADEYSAEKNLADPKQEKRGNKMATVYESWLMPTDLKDYVFDKPENSAKAKPKPKVKRKGPVDVAMFLADRGGIRDDEGHALKKSRNLQQFIPKAGPMIRANGMSIDEAGEILHEAGYFGPPDSNPRPTEAQVLDLLDRTGGKQKVYKAEDQAQIDAQQAEIDAQEAETRARDDLKAYSDERSLGLTDEEVTGAMSLMSEGFTADEAVEEVIERGALANIDDMMETIRDAGDTEFTIPFENTPARPRAEEGAGDQPSEGIAAQEREPSPEEGSPPSGEQPREDQQVAPAPEAGVSDSEPSQPFKNGDRVRNRRTKEVGTIKGYEGSFGKTKFAFVERDDGKRIRTPIAELEPAPTTDTIDTVDGAREQEVIPGAEKVSDKALAERKVEGRKGTAAQQKGLEGSPLFDPDARDTAQGGLFDENSDEKLALPRAPQTDSPEFRKWFAGSKVVDDSGKPRVLYRGDFRGDKVGEAFQARGEDQGGSGAIYFTDDPGVASNYALTKEYFEGTLDDVLGNTEVIVNGKPRPFARSNAWLTREQKKRIEDAVLSVGEHDDGTTRVGSDDPVIGRLSWDEHLQRNAGNHVKAANSLLIESAIMDKSEYVQFWKDVGVFDRFAFDDPAMPQPAVTPVYARIENPLVVEEVTEADLDRIAEIAGEDDAAVESFRFDLKNGDPHTVTMVTPKFREALESLGYDGIKDVGGIITAGGRHTVWIAFKPTQVKSATGNRGTFDPSDARIAYSLPPQSNRGRGIPDTADPPIASYRNDRPLKAHPDYKAAKGGENEAAARFVADVVKPETVDDARRRFGPDVIYVPVLAEEASGRNKIPALLATYYAQATGGQVERGISQANKAFHTGARPMERLISRPRFEGEVKAGRRYVLVDDVSVMGGTLAELAEHIQANGGEVAGVVVLANASRSGVFKAKPVHRRMIERRYGDVIREEFNVEPDALTGDEATYVLGFRDADVLRAAIAKARDERGNRLRGKGIRPPEAEGGSLRARSDTDSSGAQRGAVSFEAQAFERHMRAELDRVGLGDVASNLVEKIKSIRTGKATGADGRYFNRLIEVSLQAVQGRRGALTLNHEVIHALRDLGLFTKGEWNTLSRAAAKDTARMNEVRKRYEGQNLSRDSLIEEAVADMYADFRSGKAKPRGLLLRALNILERGLEAIGNALRGYGIRSAEGVFGKVESGKVGIRERSISGIEDRLALPRDTADKPDTVANRQDIAQTFLSKGQFLDRALRVPFDWFGGVDEKGQWKPGLKLFGKAETAIKSAEFKPDGPFGWMNAPMNAARAGLIDRYGLDPNYVKRERRLDLDKREIAEQGAELLQGLKTENMGPEEAKVLQAVLTGEEVADSDMEKIALPIRQAIDELGQEAVSLGLVSAESYERNRGTYLHRVYAKHEVDQPALAKMFTNFMAARRKKFMGEEFKGRGMFMDVEGDRLMKDIAEFAEGKRGQALKGEAFLVLDKYAPQESLENLAPANPKIERRVYWPADKPIPDRFKDFTNNGTWEVRQVSLTKATLWRDFTKAERTKMGEIMDARYTIGKTFMLMAHDLATGRFYQDVAKNGDWARNQQPNGKWVNPSEFKRLWNDPTIEWVHVPDDNIPSTGGKKKWGALAGKYVRAEIWRDLNEIDIMARPNLWTRALTQWKLNKTARSPVVHMNNIMSNVVFMDLADVRTQDLVKGIRSYLREDKDFKEAQKNGAFGSDIISQEIRREVLQPILEDLQKEMTGGVNPVASKFGVIGKLSEAIWDKVKSADRNMVKLYQIEDEVFRMAMYVRRRSLGDDAETAALEARDQFLDYDIRAPWINIARRSVLPFISYTYRAAPVIARSIATRPWKLAKYFLIAYAANALAYMIAPGDEDEERRSMRDEEKGYTWIGTPRMMRMPYRDANGNPVFLDIRRWIPAGDIFDMGQGNGAFDIPAPLQFGGPLMLGAELMLNKSAFTGDEITNDLTDTPTDKAAKISDWAWKSWLPSAAWIPGSWYWNKIGLSLKGATDMQGRPYPLPEAVASSFGIKLKPQDVEQNFDWRAYEIKKQLEALKMEARRLGRQQARGMISESAYEEAMKDVNAKVDRVDEIAREIFKD